MSAVDWRPVRDWRFGTDCLICCGNQVRWHYGMASLPAGTRAWMPEPEPPPLDFDGGYRKPLPELYRSFLLGEVWW